MKKRKYLLLIPIIILLAIGIYLLPNAFGALQEVKSVTIESSGYSTKTPGSTHIEKSGMWTEKGKARVTFDVNTVAKIPGNYRDVVFLIDISGSMEGDKLQRVKDDATSLLEILLSDSNNRAALITFDSVSEIVSGFSNNKTDLINKVNNLSIKGSTNYNAGYKNVLELLNNYEKQNNRDLVMLFLTDGYPNEDTPNQVATYKMLKDKYPYMTINGVQYEMGKDIIDEIKEVTDIQWVADIEALNNVLFAASVSPVIYDKYEIVDYIDNDYFTLNSVDDIHVDKGEVKLEVENGIQKITWTINNFMSGSSAKIDIDLILKNDVTDLYTPTNKGEKITSKLPDESEEVVNSTLTPILYRGKYQVIYDNNTPTGCTLTNNNEEYYEFEQVTKKNTQPTCSGWLFKGWEIIDNVKKINDDTFIMPGHDVTIRGTWGKTSIAKSMDGTVYTRVYCESHWKDPDDGTIYCSGTNDQVNDNYVWYSGKLWRITAIYSDGTMKLVTENNITSIAFNESGNVNFAGSYMQSWLNEEFYPTLYNASNIINTTKTWNATMTSSLETKPDNTTLVSSNVGLLNAWEYYNSYRNSNEYSSTYLNIKYFSWLLNAFNDSKIIGVLASGRASTGVPSGALGVRPALYLKSNVVFIGSGTKNNPYEIMGDKEKGKANDLINTRISGEYVKLKNGSNEQLFRIIDVEDNKTKIIAMDYADNGATRKFATSNGSGDTLWGGGATTGNNTWYTYLNNTYLPDLINKYGNLFDSATYYLGVSSYNYKLSICSNTTSGNTKICDKVSARNIYNIGLPYNGAIFATQQSNGLSNSTDMWLINRGENNLMISYIKNNGQVGIGSPTDVHGARPTLHLKPAVKILSGSGTEADPYVVGL